MYYIFKFLAPAPLGIHTRKVGHLVYVCACVRACVYVCVSMCLSVCLCVYVYL